MPNIPTYESKSNLTPSDKGINAAADAARLYARVGSEIGHDVGKGLHDIGDAVERHMAIMETSELYKTGTEFELNAEKSWAEQSALPENRGNPHFGDQFMATIGPQIDEWGSHAQTEHGKMLAATLKAGIRNKLFNHVAAGQSEMDAAHVDDNLTQTMNNYGSGLITDPSEANLHRTLGAAENTIQGVTATIPDVSAREQAATGFTAKYRPALVMTRYQGVAESIKNQIAETGGETSLATEQLDKDIKAQLGFQYLSPEQQTRLTGLKDEAVRQGQELFRSKDANARRQQDEAIQGAILEAETSMFKDNGAGGVTVVSTPALLDAMQRISRMPGAERHGGDIRALGNALHTATQDQISGKERVTDHETYMSLFERVGSTTNPLTKAEVDLQVKKLSDKDWQFLRTSAADSKLADPKISHAMSELNQWLGTIKPGIVKSNMYGGITPDSALQYSAFSWHAQDRVRSAIERGWTPEKVIHDLTDPNNANGLYRDMRPYMMTNKQGLQGVLDATKPGGGGTLPNLGGVGHTPTLPRKPGESMEAYDKRKAGN